MTFTQPFYENETFKNSSALDETIQDVSFTDCRFVDCNFSGSKFLGCVFIDCLFENCDLSLVKVKDSKFSGVTYKKTRAIGINWALASWPTNPILALQKPLIFKDCVLNFNNFYGLKLEKLSLINCIAHEVDFSEATLKAADFSGTDFEKSLFMHTNLARVDFTDAKNYAISPADNTLTAAKFSMPEAMNLLYCMDIEIVE